MGDFLQKEFYNNSVGTYLSVLGTILLALFLKRFVSKYLATILYKLVSKTGKNLHKSAFINLIIPPLDIFLFLLISFGALEKIECPKAWNIKVYKVSMFQIIDGITNMALIVAFIWLCLRVIDFVAMILEERASQTNDQSDNQLIIFFKDFFKVILVIIGVLLVLRFSLNKNIGNLITGLSIAGAAIALSTKESLENLIASFIIFFDKPFMVGDVVKVNSFSGTIEKIGLRSTRIRTEEKTYISVPNKQMVDSIVDNVSMRTQRKVHLDLDISLSATAMQLQALTPAIKRILQKPEIENSTVYLKETGKTAHSLSIDYFTTMEQTMAEFVLLREKVNFEIIALLETSNLELAAKGPSVIVMNK